MGWYTNLSYMPFYMCHARMCQPTNIINQLRRLIFTFAEHFVKIWLHLVEVLSDNKHTYTTQIEFTRICRRYTPLIRAPAVVTWCLSERAWAHRALPCHMSGYLEDGVILGILDHLGRPPGSYPESFVKIWPNLDEILRCVTSAQPNLNPTSTQPQPNPTSSWIILGDP